MKKYKLLYFVSEDEYFLSHKLDQAKSALNNNYEIMIISNFSTHEDEIKSYGFKTAKLNFDRKSINPLKEIFCFLKFLLIFKNFKPDIIQSIALKPILYSSVLSFLFAKKTKMIFCVVGLGYLFINKNISTKFIKKIYLLTIKFFICKKKSIFVFQNTDDLRIFKKHKVLTSVTTEIIRGSGVNTNFFKKKNVTKIYDLIFHSRLLYDKGILELMKAIEELKKKKISLNVLILGNPDEKNRSSIKKEQINNWEKKKLILWKPRVKKVLPYIQKSKISILPSYREGLPKSLLEAASCELPLISTNVAGCREICVDNFNGILVKSKDHISLSRAIKRLVQSPNLIRKYGKNGRILVEKNFSTKIISKKFLKLYQKSLLK